MARMPDGLINLTVTSPPYDNLRTYHGCEWSFDIFKPIAKELHRVTMDGGVVVWVVGDATIKGSETGSSFKQALYFKEECGFRLHDTMIYEKSGFPFPENNRYYQSFEYMFIFSKGKPEIINLIEDRVNITAGSAVNRPNSGERRKDGTFNKRACDIKGVKKQIKEKGVRFNIWRISNSSAKGDKLALKHPATFPEQLAHDHIISWSNPGALIYDPFAGSGTVAKMAGQTRRFWIMSEISEEYCNIIYERLNTTK